MNQIKSALSELPIGDRMEILDWLLEHMEAELRSMVNNPDDQAKVATVLEALLLPGAR